MAWFAVMGAESVLYHEQTVLGRTDDHPGQALDYYGSRGETPLRWGGTGAARLGLDGEVSPEAYRLAFGPGGFRDPLTGDQLVRTTRPGFELVVSAHKSLSLLGVLGRADDMHAILDAETAGTMDYLDAWMQARGGRRGRATVTTPTTGLVYAVTRHATSRLGDPALHDHVLIANVCEMLDSKGGYKALYSAQVRDLAEAAAMTGRLRSAARAIELGYAIELDAGASGRARDWRIAGIPAEVCEIFSKRSDQIAEYLAEKGYTGYRARNIAARDSRPVKRGTGVDELMPRWVAELEAHGWSVERLAASLELARHRYVGLARPLTNGQIDRLAAELLDPEREFMARWKVFGRARLVAEIAPRLYGHHPTELGRVVDHVLASDRVVPLIGVAGAREQAYAATAVLATEHTIAETIERLIGRPGPVVDLELMDQAIRAKQTELGHALSAGQRQAVRRICGSGRAVDVIVGVAGSGKTTALDVASRALEAAGYQVLATATSGQAARTLGHQARLPAATMRSLFYRLDHGQLSLDQRTIVVLDEASMTADVDLARLLLSAERVSSRVVIVGDHRQLAAVGPGGALHALLERHPDIVITLNQNLRQRDPAERTALDHLRAGDLTHAVGFYAANGRIHTAPTRTEALAAMVDAWATDTAGGHDTLMLAWRRATVADLNRLARVRAEQLGWLTGHDLVTRDGRGYAVGDPVVTLAPNREGELVTSQRGTVVAVDHRARTVTMLTDGRRVALAGAALDNDHLAHGYALTVNREQGATADRTHYLAEGGGRELAYVALSRARGPSIVHAVADDLGQAIEDITHDWSLDRNQQWVTRTAGVGVDPSIQTLPDDPETRRALLVTELEALERHAPPDVMAELNAARGVLDRLRRDRVDFTRGTGRWQPTPAGRAAYRLDQARRERQHTQLLIDRPDIGRRERNRWRRIDRSAVRAEALAEQEWVAHAKPVAEHLDRKVTRSEQHVAEVESHARFRHRWLNEHPELARRIAHTQRELQRLHDPIGAELLDHVDAVMQEPVVPSPNLERPDIARIRERLDRLEHQRGIDPPALSL
ncbi:MAG TPA: MobF family relaxase [Acidimicrobiales bacterium]|nr:MobF family relaxase [Acidimicrobiales bacterium]